MNQLRRYFVWMAYHGAAYHGWQAQNNAGTVQQKLQEALDTLLGSATGLTGQGRTDAGVHARTMVAHFDTPDPVSENLVARLNQLLPRDIRIRHIRQVTTEAHARYSAQYRLYRYYIHTNPDPFMWDRSWYVRNLPFPERLPIAAGRLCSQTDFGCFAKTHGGNHTNICRVEQAEWRCDNHRLVFTIKANRFLRQMVRAIVGSMVAVAQGKKSIEWWDSLLIDSPERKCGVAAPPQGLFLEEIGYPPVLFTPEIMDTTREILEE